MINACFEHRPRYLLVDEIEDLKQSDQAALLSLMQSGGLVETKVSRTRRIEFKCSVIATCNETKRLRAPLLSRFAIIKIPEYDKEQFISVTKDRLGDNPLASLEFIYFPVIAEAAVGVLVELVALYMLAPSTPTPHLLSSKCCNYTLPEPLLR